MNIKFTNFFLSFIFVFIIMILIFDFSLAVDYYEVAIGEEKDINEHDIRRWVTLSETATNELFVPTRSESEWRIFIEQLSEKVISKVYGPWSCDGQNSCGRKRTIEIFKLNGVSVVKTIEIETENARTSSEYAKFTGANCDEKITGYYAKWTSCRNCAWWPSWNWCCDWEYCGIDSKEITGSCTSGDSGSCCDWWDNCNSCRSRCITKSSRYCSGNDESC